jgi:DNA-binding transcriptional ArsR family regulator
MESKQISAKAIGLLFKAIVGDLTVSAESLSQHVKEGEKSILSGLRELREAGFLELRREKFSGRFFTKTTITSEGYQFIASQISNISKSEDFMNYLFASNFLSGFAKVVPRKRAKFSVFSADGYNGITDSDAKEFQEATEESLLAQEKRKNEAFQTTKEKGRKKRFLMRQGRNPKSWTPTDISFEFADKLMEYWNIKPWKVTKSRFTQRLGALRRQHETDGEIELIMMRIFFETEDMSSHVEPDFVASRFLYLFSNLASSARSELETPEKLRKALEDADASWKGF